jgi:signal transduction histidine kinase
MEKHLNKMNRLNAELASAREKTKREIVLRLAAEHSLKNSERHHKTMLTQSRNMQEQLRHLSRQILLAQEEERKQISRELHDEITQILTGIKIRLATLTLEASSNTRGIKKKIAGAKRMVEESVEIVHRFARDLRPAMLDHLGLIPAMQSYARSLSKRTGIRVRFEAVAEAEKLDVSKRTAIFRVAQSALNNVAQHARATRALVRIGNIPGGLSMEIKDNGRAFDAKRALLTVRPRRLGLLSMRERVEMVGGNFAVESVRGKGTTIHVRVPFRDGEVSK